MNIDWSKTTVRLKEKHIGRSHWPRGTITHQRRESQLQTDHDLWYILGGRGRAVMRNGSFELLPGTVLWMRPGGEYKITQDPGDPLSMNFIHFDLMDKKGSVRPYDAPLPPEILFPLDVRLVEVLTSRVVELCPYFGASHPVYIPMANKIAARLFEVLLMHLDAETDLPTDTVMSRTQLHHRNLVLSVANVIKENPAAVFSVSAFARKAGYSREHFSRIFKTVMGRSIETYVIEVRLIRAKEYLSDTDMTIKEIASSMGYQNENFFSRQFKKKTGTCPTSFRKTISTEPQRPKTEEK